MTVTILSVAGNIVIHLVTPTINIITIEGIAEINIMIIALLSITFLGTGGFLVIRYKLFKMAVC